MSLSYLSEIAPKGFASMNFDQPDKFDGEVVFLGRYANRSNYMNVYKVRISSEEWERVGKPETFKGAQARKYRWV